MGFGVGRWMCRYICGLYWYISCIADALLSSGCDGFLIMVSMMERDR